MFEIELTNWFPYPFYLILYLSGQDNKNTSKKTNLKAFIGNNQRKYVKNDSGILGVATQIMDVIPMALPVIFASLLSRTCL